jgi:membrane-associated phospholipid phosphatase
MACSCGPLDPLRPLGGRWEVGLARRWLRDRGSSGLCLFGSAVVILLVGVLVGLLPAKVASHDALGRAGTQVDRWFAAHRTNDLNRAIHAVADAAETPTIAALAVLTVAGAAPAWRRWREPMLVAGAVTGEVLIFLMITLLVDRPRPPVKHVNVAPATASFPSDPTAAAVALSGASYGAWALRAWQRSWSALLCGLLTLPTIAVPIVVAIAVALSRRYRGMHDSTDVLAGAMLGTGWLAGTTRGVRLGVRHHELRAETVGANPENPARWWPLPRHG